MKNLFQKSKLKNLYFGGFLFIIAALIVVSCAKNDNDTVTDTTQIQALAASQQDCSEVLVNNTVTQLLEENAENAEDMKQTMIIFHYANAFRAITENSTYKQNIIEAFIQNTLNQVTVADLISVYPAMESLLNEKLIESIKNNKTVFPFNSDPDVANLVQNPTWDANAYLVANDSYHGDTYTPTIYSASDDFSQINTTQIPTIAISQDVNDCDEIIGYKGNDTVLLGQAAVESGSDFVILVDNGDIETTSSSRVQVIKPVKANAVAATDRSMAGLTVVLDALKIKAGHRFASAKRSAKVMGGVVAFMNNPFDFGFRTDMPWNPIKVTVDDVNNSRNFTYSPGKPCFTIPMNRLENRLHMAIWEDDWFKSLKLIPLPSGCIGGADPARIGTKTRRAHSDDIYLNVCGGTINSVFPDPTTTFDNTTSTFVFTKF